MKHVRHHVNLEEKRIERQMKMVSLDSWKCLFFLLTSCHQIKSTFNSSSPHSLPSHSLSVLISMVFHCTLRSAVHFLHSFSSHVMFLFIQPNVSQSDKNNQNFTSGGKRERERPLLQLLLNLFIQLKCSTGKVERKRGNDTRKNTIKGKRDRRMMTFWCKTWIFSEKWLQQEKEWVNIATE